MNARQRRVNRRRLERERANLERLCVVIRAMGETFGVLGEATSKATKAFGALRRRLE